MSPGFNFKGTGMLTREQKATKGKLWLERWQGWQGSGVSVAEYARREGFDAQEAYRWKRILRRTGQWAVEDGAAAAVSPVRRKRRVAVRFARVALNDPPARPPSMLLRLVLGNGRRAELEVSGTTQFAELIGVLERAA
jgi:hypothetical protein